MKTIYDFHTEPKFATQATCCNKPQRLLCKCDGVARDLEPGVWLREAWDLELGTSE